MPLASIPPKSLLSGHQLVRTSSQDFVPSSDVTCESRILFPEVWWHRGWLTVPRGTLPMRLKTPFGGIFSNRWNLWVASMIFKVFLSQELWKYCSVKAWSFLREATRLLQYWSIFPFISCQKGGNQMHQAPCDISKGWEFMSSKGLDPRFRRTNDGAPGWLSR